ncbi:hypothetical protein AAAU52_07050 [Blautia hansenii]|uniref:hypothetical protein n=1 Tax=Blautia hansenii TaxID=1322 RepID=UPI0032BFBF58
MPFKMVGGECVDDTPVHKAIREALANCLINADYHGVRGVVIRKEEEKIILEILVMSEQGKSRCV